jgi:outer membrane protein assembly factor BamB
MKRTVSMGFLLALLLSASLARGSESWPQYRGPQRHGTTDGEGLLTSWADGQPAEIWRRPIGIGYSAVTAAGGRLYTMAANGEDEVVLCLDAGTGEVVWQTVVGPSGSSDMEDEGPRSTPTVADGIVYAASSAARLVALSADDGSLVWQRDLEGPAPRFGYSVSPLVDGGRVVVEAGGDDEHPGVFAFDAKSGEPEWVALTGPAGYSSPIAVEIGGRWQYVFFRRVGAAVVSLSPQGELLWQHPTKGLAIITTPIFLAPDRIFVASADDVFGGLMLRITEQDGVFATEEVWSERLMRNHFNTSVLVDGHLYGFDNGTFRCLDAETGEKKWAKRGLGKGSLVAAGGLLLVLGDDGTLVLAHATPDRFEEAGRIQAMEGRAWTAPSIADGRIYLRDFDEIVAFDLRAVEGETGSAAAVPGEAQP